MNNPQRAVNSVLALGAAGFIAAGVLSVGNPPAPKTVIRTAAVQRGDVQASVSATGNVSTPTALSLNFTTGGKVVAINVSPGDHVTAGQVLAHVDDTSTRASLLTAQANVTAAQQKLSQLQSPVTPQQAAVNALGVQQSQTAVNNAQTALAAQETQATLNATGYQNAVDQAQAQLQADQAQLAADQKQLQSDQSAGNTAAASADQQKVNADNQAVSKDNNALTNARLAQTQGLATDQQALNSAEQALASAQLGLQTTIANNAVKAAPPLPGDLASAQAGVVSAEAAVTSAQQAEDGTSLVAPTDGTITAVNGILGQTVSGSGVSAASGTGSSSSSGSGSSGSSSSFITLVNLGTLQVKAFFSETDAARVAVGQPATVTFPALPNAQVAAHVVLVDATSTVSSNVVTYGVTLDLDNPASDVKPGMSTTVSVIVSKADNVLHVPTSAVRGAGSTGTVSVMKSGKPSSVQVTVGVRGDDSVEIDSGLALGDQVVVSTGRASTTSNSLPSRFGAFTGGGLGGLGGGGGGGRGG